MVAGRESWPSGIVIIISQLLGSICGATLLAATIPDGRDASNFGTNAVAEGFSDGNAFCGEFWLTFLLLFTVFHTAVHEKYNKGSGNAAPLAIGMSVFCAHCVL